MRRVLAAIKAPIFLRGPVPIVSPFLKINLGSVRQKHAPCRLEIGPRMVKRSRAAALMFAGMGSRIKPACRITCRSSRKGRSSTNSIIFQGAREHDRPEGVRDPNTGMQARSGRSRFNGGQ
jgi:hypothetical protein